MFDMLAAAATAITRELVRALSFPSEEDEIRAFTTLLPIVTHGLATWAGTVTRKMRLPPGQPPDGQGSRVK